MVAVNLLASLLTFEHHCLYYNGEFRVILYAITLVVFCRLSDMQSPLREYMFPCSSKINWLVPLFPQILFSYIPCSLILSLFLSNFGLSSSVPQK